MILHTLKQRSYSLRGVVRSFRFPRTALAVLAAVAILGASACSRGGGPKASAFAPGGPVPVLVAKVEQKTVPIQLTAIGTVEAYSTVQVKAQVGGELTKVFFQEGDDVKKGQLLFTIDPLPYKAALQQAEANLARDLAQANQAKLDEHRYAYMLKFKAVSRQQYDTARANAQALAATVRADRAAVETAKINLGYTRITAPMSGRTGNLMVHAGNLVKANDASLVVINQIKPIYADFSLPEQDFSEVRRHSDLNHLPVTVTRPSQPQEVIHGKLSFIDNAVNTSTGTIALKGLFANAEERLWPGQFVDVTLTLREQPDTLLVPSQAVQSGQHGEFVFVVGKDMSARSRPVVTGPSLDGDTVIVRGLKKGETVVTDGQLRLLPGSKVSIKQGLNPLKGTTS